MQMKVKVLTKAFEKKMSDLFCLIISFYKVCTVEIISMILYLNFILFYFFTLLIGACKNVAQDLEVKAVLILIFDGYISTSV